MKTYCFGLCNERHAKMPKYSIFPTWVNSWDMNELENHANMAIPKDCNKLLLFATGLQVATLAVVAVCVKRNIRLTVYHYNRNTDDFRKQEVC